MKGEWRAAAAGPGWKKWRWKNRPGKNYARRIMSRLETLRLSGQMLFLAITGAAAVASCAGGQGSVALRQPPVPPPTQAYLLVVGPPDLRFAATSAHENIAPTRFFPAETNLTKVEILPAAADLADNFPIPTNAAPLTTVVMKADSTPPPASLPSVNFSPVGTDPSIVTPQMLVDYLKPTSPGKNNNSPSVVVPVNLGFTPPTAAPAPDNSSRAVYKNE
jgi:hypothetical protein